MVLFLRARAPARSAGRDTQVERPRLEKHTHHPPDAPLGSRLPLRSRPMTASRDASPHRHDRSLSLRGKVSCEQDRARRWVRPVAALSLQEQRGSCQQKRRGRCLSRVCLEDFACVRQHFRMLEEHALLIFESPTLGWATRPHLLESLGAALPDSGFVADAVRD